jgi:hypothetical protein
MECTDSLKALCMDTARSLKGSARQLCRARTVQELGPGGPRRAERALGWSRGTLRQGTQEWARGCPCLAALAARGRQPVAAHVPPWRLAIHARVASQRQTAPRWRPQRLAPRVSAAAGRRQLSAQKGEREDALPPVQTSPATRNPLGDSPQPVAPRQPPKKARRPRPSSRRSTRASRPLRAPRTCSASPWMPPRRCRAGLAPGTARGEGRGPPPLLPVPPRCPCRPWASAAPRGRSLAWTAGPHQ